MSEKKLTRFSINVGRQHRLPIDMSLNHFCKSLAEDYTKTPPSRKLIRGAFSSLPFDGKASEFSSDTLYDRVLKLTYFEQGSDGEHNTYPHAIYWETQNLLKAVCKARCTSRTLRDQPLAEKTLDILLDHLKSLPPHELASKYTDFQLLKEEYIRSKLVEDLSPEILQRLDIICRLTFLQSEKTALKTMPLAFERLDSLIMDLLQEDSIASSNISLPDPLSVLCSYYDQLVSMRPVIRRQDSENEQFTFELNDNAPFMKLLKDAFTSTQDNQPTDISNMETLFEQYLQKRAEIESPQETSLVKNFVQSYSELKTYVKTQDSWESIESNLRTELYCYMKNMFEDICKGDYIPFDYSSYQEGTAASAYMKTLCKNVHNQIGFALHLPLRLLQQHSYYFSLLQHLDDETIQKHLKTPLLQWATHAIATRKTLSEEYSSIPLLSQDSEKNVFAFISTYNDKVSPISKTTLIQGNVVQMLQVVSENDVLLSKRVHALAYLLRIECQMICYTLTEDAISQIKFTHQKLQAFYAP